MGDHLVVALAYDGLCTFEFGCTVEVFGLPRPEIEGPWYQFAVCAIEPGRLRAAGGLVFDAPHRLPLLDRADTILIPGWRDPDAQPPAALLNKLRKAHARGARIASICSGVFVLAAAGLLDGRRATTHWKFAEQLSRRHPDVDVDANALYIREDRILTSAGSAAGLDMMLHIVRLDHGAKTANIVARRLVIPPHRDGGQAQYVPRPVPAKENGQLSRLMDAVRRQPSRDYTLASMAAQAAMTPRTLQRQFRQRTGLSPIEWVIRERVGLAKDLLESRSASISRVAEQTGFGSEESFRRHFRSVVGVSPSAYRHQFFRPARA